MDAFVHCFYDIAAHQSESIKDVNSDIPPTHKYQEAEEIFKTVCANTFLNTFQYLLFFMLYAKECLQLAQIYQQ